MVNQRQLSGTLSAISLVLLALLVKEPIYGSVLALMVALMSVVTLLVVRVWSEPSHAAEGIDSPMCTRRS